MDSIERARRRLRLVIFLAVGSMSTGYIAAATVSTLAAREITGSALLAGVPAAVGTISTAAGTSALGRRVVRAGRRAALLTGSVVASGGGAVAFLGVRQAWFPLLVAGMGVVGFGHAAAHLARYTAAELVPPVRRGSAVSIVVWASTIGAVAGPRLLDPAGRLAAGLDVVEYAGGYLATTAFMSIAALLLWSMLRPDPSSLALVDVAVVESIEHHLRPFGRPGVQLAVVAMVVGHFVMVLIMTATPIHVEDSGFGLGTVGSIISAHTLGMFAFAPLVGRFVDRVGARTGMVVSAVVLAVSGLVAAAAPHDATVLLGWALFLLGLGWNFGFVAGSTMLTLTLEPDVRPLVQGRVDSMVWGVGAVATIGAGVLLDGPGYAFTALAGTALVGVLVAALVVRRPRAAVATSPTS